MENMPITIDNVELHAAYIGVDHDYGFDIYAKIVWHDRWVIYDSKKMSRQQGDEAIALLLPTRGLWLVERCISDEIVRLSTERTDAFTAAALSVDAVKSADEFMQLCTADDDRAVIERNGHRFDVHDLNLDNVQHYRASRGMGYVFADGSSCVAVSGQLWPTVAVIGNSEQQAIFQIL